MVNSIIASSQLTVILGLGVTGLSVARFLQREQQAFVMMDSRADLANIDTIKNEFEGVKLLLGELEESVLLNATTIVISPGISRKLPVIVKAVAQGVEVIGDIELLARSTNKPVIAITGSNGKTTVTTLVGELFESAGFTVAVGGNIGVPVLDLYEHDERWDFYILELSSFQLESTFSLKAAVATVLNVSPDHLDRYDSLGAYHIAKQRIYFGAKTVVTNRQDLLTTPPLAQGVKHLTVGVDRPDRHGFGIVDGQLTFEFSTIVEIKKLLLKGSHNHFNALCALAIGYAAGIGVDSMLKGLTSFAGLDHRCQTVGQYNDITYINDSKATNVGATLAALAGLGSGVGNIVLIAGGDGKNADFTPLKAPFKRYLRGLVVMGKDANTLASLANNIVNIKAVESMKDAVSASITLAKPGDIVLLSPACASLDMFNSFEHRGQCFIDAVEVLVA